MDGAGQVEQRMVTLLGVLVALTVTLVLMLAVGATMLWREYASIQRTVTTARTAAAPTTRALMSEVARRQRAVSTELGSIVNESARGVAELDRRAAQLRAQGEGGPVDNAKRAIEMTQLLADEMLLQLKLMRALDSALEKTARPIHIEEEEASESGHP